MKIAVLPGDGIGPEVTREALKVLDALSLPGLVLFEGDVGGIAYKRHGHPLPAETLEMARAADAALFGAVGDPECDNLPREHRPEQAILGLRSELGLFANLRPAAGFPGLEDLSPLKPELARGIDLLVVRELNGDVYFGKKGERDSAGGREGWDDMSYNEAEVRRIAHTGFRAAQKRRKKLTSVDKANVLETSRIWREAVIEVAAEYPDVELDHMYVDNASRAQTPTYGNASSPRMSHHRRILAGTPPMSNSTTCMSTMPPCRWCAAPASSTSSLPAICSVTSCPTRRAPA